MAERPGVLARASVRTRTTAAAVLVVAVALALGAVVLVALLRDSLTDGLETNAEQRAEALAAQVEASGPPDVLGEAPDPDEDDEPAERAEDLSEDVLEQVATVDGGLVVATTGLPAGLPLDDGATRVAGVPGDWVVVTTDAETGDDSEYVVTVAVPAEEVDDSVAALVPLLALGLPAVLLVVGATTWVVTGRALRPVERIRAETDAIGGDDLHRRVPVPPSGDEVHRLAETMNRMLGRLEDSAEKQRRFVSDASHELRSPLASLRQTAEVATAHPGAMDEGELAEATLEETVRMQRLVESLLLLTRADKGRRAPQTEVDLDDLLLAEATRLTRVGAVTVDASGVGAVRVLGDPVALGQVVRNLVDNAARHATSRVALGAEERPEGALLRVDDDGAGVAEGDRERVFERFVRLDEARSRDAGGSGLGLAIVADVVRRHGGGTWVETSPLGGARFVVRLPTTRPS
ncbi:cell wall metabolism sensor histidine kinase WalK [Nocardioides sp. CFH 31398]|uniref:sensor histidine kinase n=1 Tax=Nocardioides sp. CFH 31398 TaxID=2919579 RepID=UPI001F070490|nr:HAMP domain-containing sensor histidine kinase [Nocardioides sp. CFH 31398]MCH1868369.1 HAMP domain-containing histidine kinase [Nocardioides sp. CFH 31398]